MTTLRITTLVLVAALISACSSSSNAPAASPSNPATSVSPSVVPSPSMSSPVAQQGLDLDPVPFFFAPADAASQNLPDWMSQLSTVQMPAESVSAYTAEGILAVVGVVYTPLPGGPEPTDIFTVQYMPEAVYTDFQNRDGPQEVGNQVLSVEGNIVAVVGPQASAYDPGSVDQLIVDEILQSAYKPESYQPTVN